MKYTANTPILLDGERYEEGETIELSDKQAKALVGDKVTPVATKATKADADTKAAADTAAKQTT